MLRLHIKLRSRWGRLPFAAGTVKNHIRKFFCQIRFLSLNQRTAITLLQTSAIYKQIEVLKTFGCASRRTDHGGAVVR